MIEPITTKVTQYYVDTCLKSHSSETAYAKCILKRARNIQEKEEELTHKLMFLQMNLDKCRTLSTEAKCLEETQKLGTKIIEEYMKQIQKY